MSRVHLVMLLLLLMLMLMLLPRMRERRHESRVGHWSSEREQHDVSHVWDGKYRSGSGRFRCQTKPRGVATSEKLRAHSTIEGMRDQDEKGLQLEPMGHDGEPACVQKDVRERASKGLLGGTLDRRMGLGVSRLGYSHDPTASKRCLVLHSTKHSLYYIPGRITTWLRRKLPGTKDFGMLHKTI
jgi:hypothetical protein